jgi:hypothetical protein
MLKKSEKILVILKDKVIVSEIKTFSRKIGETFEMGWKPETLDLVFIEAKKKLKTSQFRILLGDELSYVVRVTIPSDVTKSEEKEFIAQSLQEKIPDEIEEDSWDYKVVSTEKEGKTISVTRDAIVFAVVNDFFKILKEAIKKSKIDVEVIEPEVVAKTRDANPLIGLALKEDISGKDEEVLNVRPANESIIVKEIDKSEKFKSDAEDSQSEGESSSKPTKVKVLVMISIIFFLLGVLFFIKGNPFGKKDVGTDIPSPTLGPSPTTLLEPSPTQVVSDEQERQIDFSLVSIQIQNGTGREGSADEVRSLLEEIGFTDFETGNANSFDYQETEIKIKEGTSQEVVGEIVKTLEETLDVIVGEEFLDSSSEYDVVIVVGQKF